MAVIINDVPIEAGAGIQNRYSDVSGILGRAGLTTAYRALQSDNFVSGSTGWQWTAEGNLEGNSGIFRGTLIGNSLNIPDLTSANSFHADSSGNVWWGATVIGSAVAKVLNTGVATFSKITIGSDAHVKDDLWFDARGTATAPAVTYASADAIFQGSGWDHDYGEARDERFIFMTAISDGYSSIDTIPHQLQIKHSRILHDTSEVYEYVSVWKIPERTFLPGSDYAWDLGDVDYRWKDLYLAGGLGAVEMAGEAIAAGDAVALCPFPTIDVNYDETHQQNATDGQVWGNEAGKEFIAQEFIAGATSHIMQVGLYLKKEGSPTDNINVEIWSDNSSVPGVKLSTITLSGSSLTGSFAWYTVYLGDFIPVTATNYHIVLSRSGANDASNYYIWAADISTSSPAHSSGYTNTSDATRVLRRGATATTVATISIGVSPHSDAIFKTYKADTTLAVLMKTRGTSDFLTKNFIGFAPSAIAYGNVGSVIRQGSVDKFSGLIPGLLYYLSDTAGAISTSPGTYNSPVLVAKYSSTGEIISLQPRVPSISPRFGGQNTKWTAANNTNEQIVYSTTLFANTLGINGVIRVLLTGHGYSGNSSAFGVKLGSTTLIGKAVPSNLDFRLGGEIANRGVTNSQTGSQLSICGDTIAIIPHAAGSEDTTTDLTLTITYTAAASGGTPGYVEKILIEVLR